MRNDTFAHRLHTRRIAAVLTEMGALLRSPEIQDPDHALAVLDILADDLEECRRILRPEPPRRPRWPDETDDTLPF